MNTGLDISELVEFITPDMLDDVDGDSTTHRLVKELNSRRYESKDNSAQVTTILEIACDFFWAHMGCVIDIDFSSNAWEPVFWHELQGGSRISDKAKHWKLSYTEKEYIKAIVERDEAFTFRVATIETAFPGLYRRFRALDVNKVLGIPYSGARSGLILMLNPSLHLNRFALMYEFRNHLKDPLHQLWVSALSHHVMEDLRPIKDNDVVIRLMGELEIISIFGTIDADELRKMKGIVLFMFLCVQDGFRAGKTLTANRICDSIELDNKNNFKNMDKYVRRFNEKFQERIGGQPLILYDSSHYYLNPYYDIQTDLMRFNELMEAIGESVLEGMKTDLMKKLVKLYRGQIFSEYSSMYWAHDICQSVHRGFLETVEELCRTLDASRDYVAINKYVAKAIQTDRHNYRLYYWTLVALYKSDKQGMGEGVISVAHDLLDDHGFRNLRVALVNTKGLDQNLLRSAFAAY